ncbi:MAG TPA: ABC transporter substrate-binding protein [Acidimicrobiales bacterium]|nr:ABC transporter substrate-binding protein [Acidimicrobiales bacterium]
MAASHQGRRARTTRAARLAASTGIAGLLGAAALAGIGSSGPALAAAAGAPKPAQSSGVDLVSTTPAPKGDLSSITWDLPYGEPASLDYVQAGDYSPDVLISNMCDDLLRLTPTFGIAPGLATSWHYTSPTTLVFDIRQGVHFWDGTELTSADVAYSMLRNLDPKDDPVNGAYYASVKSITATGPFQVTVKFTAPDELFVKEMATISGAIAEKAYMEKEGSAYGTSRGGVMCTGPYELKQWSPGNDVVLQANPHYWDPAYRPRITTITVKFIVDTSTLTSALLSGEIDGAYEVPAAAYPELRSSSSGTLYFGPSLVISELAPTTSSGPIGNAKIRQALSLALDRQAIADVIYDGAATPNLALTPATAWDPAARPVYQAAYAKLGPSTPQIAEAKRLVDSVPDHSAPIVLALEAGNQTELELATAVQQAASEIGLDVTLDEMQPLAFGGAFFVPSYRKGLDMLVDEGYLDVPDPLDYLGLWFPKGAVFDYTNYNDATVNTDLAKAIGTYDATARAKLITAAQAIYMKDYIVIPIVNPDEGLYMNDEITGAPASFAYIYEPCFAKLGAAR